MLNSFSISGYPKIKIIADQNNSKSQKVVDKLKPFECKKPEMVVVVGGDGFMLKAIRKYCNLNIPFLGINVGHRGFLLNEIEFLDDFFNNHELVAYTIHLLQVNVLKPSGETRSYTAFNEALIERAGSQAGWIEISVNDKVCISKLVADGVLVATPAGSTAYAMAMGASPIPLGTEAFVLVGSNTSEPLGFKPCYLQNDCQIKLSNAGDFKKRPLYGVVDGVKIGLVNEMIITKSIQTVTLLFIDSNSLTSKLNSIQFNLNV